MDQDRVIELSAEEYRELERALQWPEDLERWDKINTPTNLTEIEL